jgi:hypothetical protein
MITLRVSSSIKEVTANLKQQFKRQIPFAASRAINEMAFETREMIKDLMKTTYEGGVVTYTQNAIYSNKSTKRKLSAQVYVGGNDQHRIAYILNTIDGGKIPVYKEKPFSPNKKRVRVTKVGHNMPRGFVKRGLQKEAHFIYTAQPGKPKGKNGKMPSGLYRRRGTGKRAKIELLVAFYDDQVNKKTLPAKSASAAFVKRHFTPIFYKHLKQAIATAK